MTNAAETNMNLDDLLTVGREQKMVVDDLKAQLKVKEAVFNETKDAILQWMRDLGVDATKTEGVASVTVSRKLVPNAQDWELIYEWVLQEGNPEIFMKQITQSAYQELRERGVEVPGCTDFIRESLAFRILK